MEPKRSASPTGPGQDASARPQPQSTGKRIFVWVILLLIFGIIFVFVLRHHDDSGAAPSGRRAGGTVTVTTVTAQKGNIGVYLDAIGTVTPVYTSSITSQVTGLVSQVHYREGQLVRKGDPL